MTFRKRQSPPKLTKKLIQAHFNAQAPLGAEQPDYKRKKPRKFVDDGIPELSGHAGNVPCPVCDGHGVMRMRGAERQDTCSNCDGLGVLV